MRGVTEDVWSRRSDRAGRAVVANYAFDVTLARLVTGSSPSAGDRGDARGAGGGIPEARPARRVRRRDGSGGA